MDRPVDTAGSDPRPGEMVPDSGRELTRGDPNAVWEPVVSLPTESVAVSTDLPETESEPVAPHRNRADTTATRDNEDK
jgi:hypothetical protein